MEKKVDVVKTIAVSGGFIALHAGHIRLLREAAFYGNLTVILNSDAWQERKYGKVIVPYERRAEVLWAIKYVGNVVQALDDDGTVCKSLEYIRPDYFANGGDRMPDNTPELLLCAELGIRPLFGVGGEIKLGSSSEIMSALG